MTGRADVRLVDRPGIFEADQCEIAGAWLHAEGRWRSRERRSYTWPHRSVAEVRWAA